MSKNISVIEDLLDLIPTSPFSISLDNQKEQKNTLVLSESISFQESDELNKSEEIVLYSADIKLYLEADAEFTDFNSIHTLLKTFYDNVREYEGSYYKEKYIFEVKQNGLFGYLGRDKQGLYCFSCNFRVRYYIKGGLSDE